MRPRLFEEAPGEGCHMLWYRKFDLPLGIDVLLSWPVAEAPAAWRAQRDRWGVKVQRWPHIGTVDICVRCGVCWLMAVVGLPIITNRPGDNPLPRGYVVAHRYRDHLGCIICWPGLQYPIRFYFWLKWLDSHYSRWLCRQGIWQLKEEGGWYRDCTLSPIRYWFRGYRLPRQRRSS